MIFGLFEQSVRCDVFNMKADPIVKTNIYLTDMGHNNYISITVITRPSGRGQSHVVGSLAIVIDA